MSEKSISPLGRFSSAFASPRRLRNRLVHHRWNNHITRLITRLSKMQVIIGK
jgi:hypothetical protein